MRKVIEAIVRLRVTAGRKVSDSSTLITLRYDGENLAEDENVKDGIHCTSYVKLRNFNHDGWASKETNLGVPNGTLGWFDLALDKKFPNINSLLKGILRFREEHGADIAQLTSVIHDRKVEEK
jgi:hypothetical protein